MPRSQFVNVRSLGFQYPGSAASLFENFDVHFDSGFTGIVGANGSGKSTLLQLIGGELTADFGQITGTEGLIHCAQRTDLPPDRFADFLDGLDGSAYRLRGRLGIEHDFLERWQHLSHGERKRAQIATALWQAPAVLTIDEPTNHIDTAARSLLLDNLKRFRGVGIIVSHDRALLDELCNRTLWLDDAEPRLYLGGYSKASKEKQLDHDALMHERGNLRRDQKRLEAEVSSRKSKAASANKQRSKAGVSSKDHDAKSKIDLARVSGKDGQAGRLLKQMSGRKQQLDEKVDSLHVKKQRDVGIWLEGATSKRNSLLDVGPLELELGEYRTLATPNLIVPPNARIAITGANGMGKSTLLAALKGQLNVPDDHLIYMPQEISMVQSQNILVSIKALPKQQLGQLMTIVSCLGSDPKNLLSTSLPSPGEVRKLMLVLGIARRPWLIVMDEPTNHLDLPSIEALEQALESCPCGLILVSHDESFLSKLATTYWHLSEKAAGSVLIVS